MGKEPLSEVLGVGHLVALSAHIGVEGIPISATELLQRRGGRRRLLIHGREHDAPMRGGKQWLAHRAWSFRIVPPRHAAQSSREHLRNKVKSRFCHRSKSWHCSSMLWLGNWRFMDVFRFLFGRGKSSLRPIGYYRKLRTSPGSILASPPIIGHVRV